MNNINVVSRSDYFPALTGARAIVAYMVFLCHFVFFNPLFFPKFIHNFFNEFYIGVSMFFVLSGFLITYKYYELDSFNFKEYIVKRISRIYPMYFILTTFTFIFFAIYYNQTSLVFIKIYLLNVTFLRSFFEDFVKSGIAPGWSLTLEEIFYLLAPIFFVLIKKSKIYMLVIPIFFIALGVIIVNFLGAYNYYGFMRSYSFMFDFTIFGRICEFMVGILLALVYIKKKDIWNTKYITFIGVFNVFIGVYILSILKGDNIEGIDSILGKIVNTLLIPFFGVAPLYWGLIKERTIFSRILSTKLFVLLGKSSYVFYLIHTGAFLIIIERIYKNHLFVFIVLNIISVTLYLFIEKPLNSYFRKFKHFSISSSGTIN